MFQSTNQVALEFSDFSGRSRLTEQIDQPPTPAFQLLDGFFQLQLCLRQGSHRSDFLGAPH